jgi:HSP90 family molecular chaperone
VINHHEGIELNSNLSNSEVFKFKESPEAFHILSSSLYSNPHKAIIRELLCNAIDAGKRERQ